MTMTEVTMVKVEDDVHRQLNILKATEGFKTISDTIRHLLEYYEANTAMKKRKGEKK